MTYLKGATMYELQIGRLMITWCHLSGEYWKGKPWRRIGVWVAEKDE